MKVYNTNGNLSLTWLNKIGCLSLRYLLTGKTKSWVACHFKDCTAFLPISAVEGMWYMDVQPLENSFGYTSLEGAKADKAVLLTIIAEAL